MKDDSAPPELRFVWSDAWVLLSLVYLAGPAKRREIVAVDDFIEHAVMTRRELESGLTRLLEAGHAVASGSSFAAARSVRGWYESAGASSRRHVWKDIERVKGFLGIPT